MGFNKKLLRAREILALAMVNSASEGQMYFLAQDIPELGAHQGDYVGTLAHSVGFHGNSGGIFFFCKSTNPLVEMRVKGVGEACYFPSPWFKGHFVGQFCCYNPYPHEHEEGYTWIS